jgi:dolichol kinase
LLNDGGRKGLHVAVALTALTWRWIPPPVVIAVVVATIVHNRWILPLYAPTLFREGEREGRRGFRSGIVLYPMGVLIVAAVFLDRLALAAAAWGVLAAGDGFATIVGRSIGRVRWPWNPNKTAAGSVAFVIAAAPFAAFLGSFVSSGSFLEWLGPCAAAALVGAFVESLSLSLDDNLTVPLTAAAVLAVASAVGAGSCLVAGTRWGG